MQALFLGYGLILKSAHRLVFAQTQQSSDISSWSPREAPTKRSLCNTKWSLLDATRESACSNEDPVQHKHIIF